MERFDIAIIGTGPAGISAAITAKLRNKNLILFGSGKGSEKVAKASVIKNYPGLPGISGTELRESFAKHLEAMDVPVIDDKINAVYSMGRYFFLKGSKGDYESSSLILATGVDFAKPLAGEKEFLGRGVSYCATCDGMFYKQKKVAVLAYESGAWKESLYLSELCSEVLYFKLHKEPMPGTIPSNVSVVDEKPEVIKGNMKAEVLVAGGREHEVDGIFVLRDAVAADSLVPGLKTEDGHVFVDRHMRTNIPGCFACGDVAGMPYQYIKAAGEGNVAALSAVSYLADLIDED
ncbi:NAD(P)/FAD-dependent oxidoreductase [Treponema sp.]|uniref:NAD(P)/FAD-dependent oxidoreductase n=1 Tax=Treponema sp. TaxID=166 RepID=UPI00388E1096